MKCLVLTKSIEYVLVPVSSEPLPSLLFEGLPPFPVCDMSTSLFAQTGDLLILLPDVRSEVYAHFGFLGFQNDRAIAEEILNDAVLALIDILQNPQIGAFMVIHRDECFFDSMDFLIRHDDDMEEVVVETSEEFEMREEEESREEA